MSLSSVPSGTLRKLLELRVITGWKKCSAWVVSQSIKVFLFSFQMTLFRLRTARPSGYRKGEIISGEKNAFEKSPTKVNSFQKSNYKIVSEVSTYAYIRSPATSILNDPNTIHNRALLFRGRRWFGSISWFDFFLPAPYVTHANRQQRADPKVMSATWRNLP